MTTAVQLKTCRSCSAPLYWAQVLDRTGAIVKGLGGRPKVIPVDAEPSKKGNIQLYVRAGIIVARALDAARAQRVRDAASALGGQHTLRLSHFATCPNAADHRRTR